MRNYKTTVVKNNARLTMSSFTKRIVPSCFIIDEQTMRQSTNSDTYRVNGLYLILLGTSASAPRRRFLSSIYSSKFPSNHSTWLSPSKARICVAMRSRNQRSWEMMTAQPAKSSIALSSSRKVSTSRSLVGSSRRRRLTPSVSILASCTRLRSPPERLPTFFC